METTEIQQCLMISKSCRVKRPLFKRTLAMGQRVTSRKKAEMILSFFLFHADSFIQPGAVKLVL